MSGEVSALVSPRGMGPQNEIRSHTLGRTCVLVSKWRRLGEIRSTSVVHTRLRNRSRKAQSGRHKARNTGTRCRLVARCEPGLLSNVFETTIAEWSGAAGKNT